MNNQKQYLAQVKHHDEHINYYVGIGSQKKIESEGVEAIFERIGFVGKEYSVVIRHLGNNNDIPIEVKNHERAINELIWNAIPYRAVVAYRDDNGDLKTLRSLPVLDSSRQKQTKTGAKALASAYMNMDLVKSYKETLAHGEFEVLTVSEPEYKIMKEQANEAIISKGKGR